VEYKTKAELNAKIELARSDMESKAEKLGLLHPEVLVKSQKLDELIVLAQSFKKK
jgi:hypothetical protein